MRVNWKNHILAALSVVFCIGNAGFVSAQPQIAPAATTTATKAPPSAHDFSVRTNRSFTISPNGKKLAYLSGEGSTAKVFVIDIETAATDQVPAGSSEVTPKYVEWANDEFILITLQFSVRFGDAAERNKSVYGIERIMAYSTITKTAKVLMPHTDLEFNTGLSIEYSNFGGSDIVMGGFIPVLARDDVDSRLKGDDSRNWRAVLYTTDLRSGRGRELDRGTYKTEAWVFDAAGNVRMRKDIDYLTRIASFWIKDGRNWRKLLEYTDVTNTPFEIEGLLDNNTALVLDYDGNKRVAKKLNLTTGALTPAYSDETKSISGVATDPFTNVPIALFYEGLTPQRRWLDPDLARLQNALNRAFPNKHVYLTSWSRDKKQIVVGVESGSHQYQNYLFDTTSMQAQLLTELEPSFEGFAFPTKELLKFNARDGLEIPVFVTKPIGEGTRRLPTIVMPHGGPESSDDAGFDYVAQFLATRGYLVIQPQFRGSTGNGIDFSNAGYGEWGGKMQNDVSDSLKWAIEQGWADSSRVCIVGASYGGYAALAGATMTPELYACAISFAGVSDLALMQISRENRSGKSSGSVSYWREHMGLTRFETAKIHAISPAHLAQNVRAPILLMHGRDDTVVLINQSQVMANALRRAGKTFEFIELDGEDHHLSKQETRERYLVEMERFLAPILRPGQ
ncbi:MAG: hypothetical protein FD163_1428 [Hyphomonadaceae bacterium]|nr:MAG: hypothetical protein FD163_1428 [Hyphomonadaceae bacterium]